MAYSSVVLEFPDLKGHVHRCVLPGSTFAARSGEAVVRPLLEEGLNLSSAKTAAELVRRYLMQARPEKRFLLVDKPGWHGDLFALNDQIFGDATKISIIQRADRNSHLRVKGTWENWKAGIGAYANGNKRLQFALNLPFAAPLVYLVARSHAYFI